MGNPKGENKKSPIQKALEVVMPRQIFRGLRVCFLGIENTGELQRDIITRGGKVHPSTEFETCTHLCIRGLPTGMILGGPNVVNESWIKNSCDANKLLVPDNKLAKSLDIIYKEHHQLFLCPSDHSKDMLDLSAAAEITKEKRKLYITPGSLHHPAHLSSVTDNRIKLLVKMTYVLFKRLHLAGLTLKGRYTYQNLIVEEAFGQITIRLGFLHEGQLERFSKAGGDMDMNQLQRMVTHTIFKGSIPGHDLNLWLSLLEDAKQKDAQIKDMLVDSVLLMSIEASSDLFNSLYDSFITADSTVRLSVQAELAEYNGWQKIINGKDGNFYLQQTFEHKDKDGKSGAQRYQDTVQELLRLLRNSRQHEALQQGEVFALVVGHHFCNLIADLQRALYLARKK